MWSCPLITGKSKRALSLAELMVVISLILLFGVLIVKVYHITKFYFLNSDNRIVAQQNGRLGIMRISNLLKSAVPPSTGSASIVTPASGSSGSYIDFRVSKLALGMPLSDYRNLNSSDFPTLRIGLSGNNVVVTGVPSGATTLENNQVLCREVQNLNFAVSGTTVTATLTLRSERSDRNADGSQTSAPVFSAQIPIPFYYLTK